MLVVLAGMAFLSLFVAGLINKYESYMAEKRLVVQRLLRGIAELQPLLDTPPEGGIPQGMGQCMRQEILARYIAIKKVMPNHPGINQSINQSGLLLQQEPAGLTNPIPPSIAERMQLDDYWKKLGQFMHILQSGDLGSGIGREKRAAYQQFILLLKAESASAYFKQSGAQMAEAGDFRGALGAIRALDGYLQSIDLISDRFLELKRENKERFVEYCQQQLSA